MYTCIYNVSCLHKPRYSSSHWPTPHAHNQHSRQQQHLTELGPPPCQLTNRSANHQLLHTTPLALKDRHGVTDKTTAPMRASPLAQLTDCFNAHRRSLAKGNPTGCFILASKLSQEYTSTCARTGSFGGESVSVTAFSGNPNSKGIIANCQAQPPSTIASCTSTA